MPGTHLHSLSKAAVTITGGLQPKELVLPRSGAQRSESKVSKDWFLLSTLWENLLHIPLPVSLLGVLGLWMRHSNLCLHLHVVFYFLFSVSKFLSACKDSGHIG